MSWKLTPFVNKHFDGLIGQNLLKPLQAIVNLEEEFLEIHGVKTKFISSCPYKYNDIHTLHESILNEDLLNKLIRDDMNQEEITELRKIINKNRDLFFQEGQQLTHTHEIQHQIITTVDKPIYSKIYRYPQIHEEEITRQMKEMLAQGIIRESNSPYNSPLWIVPKKIDNSGKKKWRIVIDYRKLNEVSISDKYPIPNIETILEKLGRSQYFTTLDLAKGFHQVLIKQDDRKKKKQHSQHPLDITNLLECRLGLKMPRRRSKD